MPSADQWERVADRVCRALGGVHGAAASVACPVGVRLLREVAAPRLEGRARKPAAVLDTARKAIRTLAGLPDPEPDAPDDEVEVERGPTGPNIPSIPIIPHVPKKVGRILGARGRPVGAGGRTVADIVSRLTKAGINVPKFRKLKGFAQHAVNGGFIPGESGF